VGVGVDMVVVVLDRFSCNDVKRLEVVVVQVGLVGLGVLGVLACLAYRDLPYFLSYRVVQPVLDLPGYPVGHSFQEVPVGRA